jgi:hypothetical protein
MQTWLVKLTGSTQTTNQVLPLKPAKEIQDGNTHKIPAECGVA